MLRASLTTRTLVVSLLCGACTSQPPEDMQSSDGTPAVTASPVQVSLESATALGVLNARMPVPQLITAGQPTQEQLDGLADAGFEHFISLRPSTEDGAGWEEAHATAAGVDFERLPVAGAAGLTRENVEAFARLLEAAGDQPTVIYCQSSNRVGALMALKAHWMDGSSPEDAFELGQQAGMTSLTEPVREMLGLSPGASR